VGDHQREHPGSFVQELKMQPSWNFSFFRSAANKTHSLT
jgi:hypothetical protein